MKSVLRPLVAAAVVASCALVPSGAAGAGPRPASAGERASFIVSLRPGVDPRAAAAEWRTRGADIAHVYRHALSGFAGRMGPELAEQLRRDARVARVERDGPVAVVGTQTSPPWGLDRIDQRTRPLDGAYAYDHDGTGVTVYVLDTGVRSTHIDFGGRVGSGYTVIADGYGTGDCHGHGTHVAGTAAGAVHGAAKSVAIVPVRVLDCKGSGSISGVIAGVDWVTSHHSAGVPAVANMSLGGGASSSLDTAVRNSIADGITYAVAAGNESTDACTKSPARVAEALTVAATTSSDARASYSNWGTCVDLFAPGSSITSAYHSSDTATATMSGTSMAAPHVAGIAALYLTAAPSAAPSTVAAAVVDGATTGVVSDTAGSPNRLAYSRLTAATEPITDPVTATAPAAPAAPSAAGEKRAVSVAWSAPADGGSAITSYDVRVHRASDGVVVKTATVSGSTRKTKVGGLTSKVTYFATVRASNAVGVGDWSPPSNNATTR